MNKLAQALHLFFIPDSSKNDEQEFRKARILVNTSFITSFFAFSFGGQTFLFKQYHLIPFMLLWGGLFFSLPWLLRSGVPRRVCANLFVLITFVSALYEVYWTGGLQSAILPWMSMVAVTAILLNTTRNAVVWFIIATIATNGIFIASSYIHFPIEIDMKFYDFSVFLSCFGLVAIMFVIAMVMENAFIGSLKKLDQKNKIIEAEKKRSDELLLNILPSEVMEELKATGKTLARNYDLVTVFFLDFIDFTTITEEMPPEELVSSIDSYFKLIDDVVSKFTIEKIKTVGDAYICAAGLPAGSSDNPVVMVQAALDIVNGLNELNKKRKTEGKTVFEVRIGIHSGPLVAGVVGVKKFAYDIWGDTVNTAARMQQNGEAGKINISGTTRELVKHRYVCNYRGRIEVKHKGQIDMYFVEGKK
jgi:adenylate cyclase